MNAKSEIIGREFIKEVSNKAGEKTRLKFPYRTFASVFLRRNSGDNFLANLITEGRQSRDKSPSGMPLLAIEPREVAMPDITNLAKNANYADSTWLMHKKVEDEFLLNDPYTIAVEVPVFDEEISGFIDILRFFPAEGELPASYQILDFKPKAQAEKKACTQLFYYRKLFCGLVKINPELVSLFYFDDQKCFKVLI